MNLGVKPKEYPTVIGTSLMLIVLILWAVCGVIGLKTIIGGVYGFAKESIREVDVTQRIKAEQYPSRPLV